MRLCYALPNGQSRLSPRPTARTLLARHGVAAIWLLHLAAAKAYREGNTDAATSVIEIADAAEREWLRAEAAV